MRAASGPSPLLAHARTIDAARRWVRGFAAGWLIGLDRLRVWRSTCSRRRPRSSTRASAGCSRRRCGGRTSARPRTSGASSRRRRGGSASTRSSSTSSTTSSGRWCPVPRPDADGTRPLSIRGTVAGRAFASTSILDVEAERRSGRRLWVPLLDGTERVGVLRADFAGGEPLHRAAGRPRASATRISSPCSSSARARTPTSSSCCAAPRPMTLASELVWALVPPLVLASEDFVLSALLEPCYDIGGDAFDYALNDGVLHFAVFDAMGHGLAAAGMAALALSAYRHSRRAGTRPPRPTRRSTRRSPGRRAHEPLRDGADRRTRARHRTACAGSAPATRRRCCFATAGSIKSLDVAPAPPLALQLAAGPADRGTRVARAGRHGAALHRRPDRGAPARAASCSPSSGSASSSSARRRAGGRAGDAAAAARGDHRARRRRADTTTPPPCWSNGAEPALARSSQPPSDLAHGLHAAT